MNKKLYLVSLGCPKNFIDSEVMLAQLERAGYCVCGTPEEADLLLVNTCGFIQTAVEEAIDEILWLARIKAEDPVKKLVVTGCLVQRYGTYLQAELPEVDLFIGTEGFQNIVDRVNLLGTESSLMLELSTPTFLMDCSTPRRISTPSHRAYLKITEGRGNRCSFCLIPLIRGPLRSRLPADLIKEACSLEDAGVKELTLIAQDLTAYGLDVNHPKRPRLDNLVKSLLEECGIPWIRLLYLHPARVNEKLLDLMASNPRLLSYLDIPLQHVNSRILRLMNRSYDRSYIESLIYKIRRTLPDAAIRTTFMVGFPGETESDLAEMEEFIRIHRLEHVGVFTYSNEEGCVAASFPDQCPEDVKQERYQYIMELQAGISLERNRKLIGKNEKVLVEGQSRETDLLMEGRTRHQAPEIDGCVYITSGECKPGDILDIRITDAHFYDLAGEIIGS